jgi:hemin uptake protein HemP
LQHETEPVKQKILYKPNKLGQQAQTAQEPAQDGAAPGVASEKLLGPAGELKIRHNGETYSLRKTRFNKLILTK